MQVALNSNLTPLLCIGELLEDRDSGKTQEVVSEQIQAVIDLVGINAFKNIIIAYEPVWAIGTGITATPHQAQDIHAFIRSMLAKHDDNISQITRLFMAVV